MGELLIYPFGCYTLHSNLTCFSLERLARCDEVWSVEERLEQIFVQHFSDLRFGRTENILPFLCGRSKKPLLALNLGWKSITNNDKIFDCQVVFVSP